ncbi:MAG TPA: hypothetical protein ENK02_05685 [Planctomycetes bacterium]|nr:hypothetical protein [Planctomycetota bacterium]
MRNRRLLRLILSCVLFLGGSFLIWDGFHRTRPAPPPSTYLGPLRYLTLPFLWSEWGEARRAGRLREATEYGKWITFFLPERWDLFLGFAWDLAYDLPGEARDPHFRAEALVQALLLLEEGMRFHPGVKRLPLMAAFLLQDRVLTKEDPSLEKAFEEIVGAPPRKAFRSYLDRLIALSPGQKLPDLREEVARGFVHEAKEYLKRGHLEKAGERFARAATVLEPSAKERAQLFREAATTLDAGKRPSQRLLSRLAEDPLFAK